MAEVVSKEPVLIENVNLIINVFNIGNDGTGRVTTLGPTPVLSQLPEGISGRFPPEPPFHRVVETDEKEEASEPLGWIANYNGDDIPFGVKSIAEEIQTFGDRRTWKEIKVCLPPSLLVDETVVYCPVPSCRERIPRNKSIDSHIMKHLGFECWKSGGPCNSNSEIGLSCPLHHYCQEKNCQYYVEAEKSFKAFKNLKQHYHKVHAPRLYECDLCKRTFSTQKVLGSHKLMCGEKYICTTCGSVYTSMEVLQTHCRRKAHVYDHEKYKGLRNSKQEVQSLKSVSPAPAPTSSPNPIGRKGKGLRKFPVLLPKASPELNEGVLKGIQAICQQAGLKVDYGCQTVCTAIIQKINPIEAEAVMTSSTSSTSPPATQKKRKSTDTQTNIVKFRATGLDQKHNATNTNQDWKKVITSDSETQTAENCDNMELTQLKSHDKSSDTSAHFNSEFATIKISETASDSDCQFVLSVVDDQNSAAEVETDCKPAMEPAIPIVKEEADSSSEVTNIEQSETMSEMKDLTSPDFYQDFMSMLEVDSATQTEPDIFENLGGDFLGINVNFDEVPGTENTYVSVSSTASQTAGENVPKVSLSSEDYELLLNANQSELMGADIEEFTDVMNFFDKSYTTSATSEEELAQDIDFFDWENLNDEQKCKNSKL
ncbi:unnamed protein product [Orchesella dallaii]|uniref:C2H2-type domain-containing protein n=1 Tax=Orchesella dallaii TaxID=48710 RepID=A0ABP1PMN1_9HEXA